jgi:hypothetical protein
VLTQRAGSGPRSEGPGSVPRCPAHTRGDSRGHTAASAVQRRSRRGIRSRSIDPAPNARPGGGDASARPGPGKRGRGGSGRTGSTASGPSGRAGPPAGRRASPQVRLAGRPACQRPQAGDRRAPARVRPRLGHYTQSQSAGADCFLRVGLGLGWAVTGPAAPALGTVGRCRPHAAIGGPPPVALVRLWKTRPGRVRIFTREAGSARSDSGHPSLVFARSRPLALGAAPLAIALARWPSSSLALKGFGPMLCKKNSLKARLSQC